MKESDTDRWFWAPTKPVETDEEKKPGPGCAGPLGQRPGRTDRQHRQASGYVDDGAEPDGQGDGIENFGTMRKHEVIFTSCQKNAEQSGVLFSEGVLEVLSEGLASCVRRVSLPPLPGGHLRLAVADSAL